jgi:hypothetical protein
VNDSRPRLWFRFSLRRLLLAIAIIAIWLGWNAYQLRLRRSAEQYLATKGINGSAIAYGWPEKPWKSLPIGLRLLGVKPVRSIDLQQLVITDEEVDTIQALFPEADIYAPQMYR